MIKFFRKIRYDLMGQNKTGKYLKYAVGEIVLVVIGILLALQINNWNQERINQKRVTNYLINLVEDIKSDIVHYKININGYKDDLNNNKRLFINDDYKLLAADSLLKLVNSYYHINRTSSQTYEKIKNAGLIESLGSETTNKAVNDYYNLEIIYYINLFKWDKEYSNKDSDFWFYNETFESSSDRDYKTNALAFLDSPDKRKNDLINLIESIQGRNHLRGAIIRKEHTLKRVQELKSVAENLIKMINQELEKRL